MNRFYIASICRETPRSVAAIPHAGAILPAVFPGGRIRFRYLFASNRAYEGNSTSRSPLDCNSLNANSTRMNSLLRIARNLPFLEHAEIFRASRECRTIFELFVNACCHRGALENLS